MSFNWKSSGPAIWCLALVLLGTATGVLNAQPTKDGVLTALSPADIGKVARALASVPASSIPSGLREWVATDRAVTILLEVYQESYVKKVPKGKARSFPGFVMGVLAETPHGNRLSVEPRALVADLAEIRLERGHLLYPIVDQRHRHSPRKSLALEHELARRELALAWGAAELALSKRDTVILASQLTAAEQKKDVKAIVDLLIPNLHIMTEKDLRALISACQKQEGAADLEVQVFARWMGKGAELELQCRAMRKKAVRTSGP